MAISMRNNFSYSATKGTWSTKRKVNRGRAVLGGGMGAKGRAAGRHQQQHQVRIHIMEISAAADLDADHQPARKEDQQQCDYAQRAPRAETGALLPQAQPGRNEQ